ncbi:Hypothetical predicted protein [Pelobates cultripes]|uniref:Uncharacterized protein n=1 Tax=Pelobates cultripes TaxID=61616 RepID=A0AAD1T0U4_PELCU|nr:Hypothetical predicted protein [Pelobates cultripes]
MIHNCDPRCARAIGAEERLAPGILVHQRRGPCGNRRDLTWWGVIPVLALKLHSEAPLCQHARPRPKSKMAEAMCADTDPRRLKRTTDTIWSGAQSNKHQTTPTPCSSYRVQGHTGCMLAYRGCGCCGERLHSEAETDSVLDNDEAAAAAEDKR